MIDDSNINDNYNQTDENEIIQIKNDFLSSDAVSDSRFKSIFYSRETKDIYIANKLMETFNFKGMHIMEAFKLLEKKVVLPTESQLVNQIINIFCRRYSDCNTDLYTCEQYTNIFHSILMLNKAVLLKDRNYKTTREQWLTLLRHTNVDENYLINIYNSVTKTPMISGHLKDYNNIIDSKKRSKIDTNSSLGRVKKVKNEEKPKQHFGAGFLSRKVLKTGKLLDKTIVWKKYFASLDDLSLSLYKDEDIREYLINNNDKITAFSCMMKDSKFATFIRSQTPVEVMPIEHCLAKPILDQDCRFLIYLKDQSKYCFKVSKSTDVEFWNSTINYTAALLSRPNDGFGSVDQLCFGSGIYMSGITTLNIVDQIDTYIRHCEFLRRQKQYIEDLDTKPPKYNLKLKYVNYQIERFETYIRHLKITIQQQQQQPQPQFSFDDHSVDTDVDSLNTYKSLCGGSEMSSRGSVIFESKSKKLEIGSPDRETDRLNYDSE